MGIPQPDNPAAFSHHAGIGQTFRDTAVPKLFGLFVVGDVIGFVGERMEFSARPSPAVIDNVLLFDRLYRRQDAMVASAPVQ